MSKSGHYLSFFGHKCQCRFDFYAVAQRTNLRLAVAVCYFPYGIMCCLLIRNRKLPDS
ncbi:DUF2367 domain-containing protein [Larkinella humicola]|uniref:DUF2367 domain-containing protein n=1 Tax=Larkinella humicola TaxID=2607654 RepID=A0A5N1J7K2_9BACT|nr:DUF2367 domain-containing protein [Larkinella humicola]